MSAQKSSAGMQTTPAGARHAAAASSLLSYPLSLSPHGCCCCPLPAATGAVLDGRDVGTVICPDAALKLYVTADVTVRAQRRLDELISRGVTDTSYEEVLADMKARDDRDMNRATAPLKPADDALILDTTQMSIEEAYQQAVAAVTARRKEAVPA